MTSQEQLEQRDARIAGYIATDYTAHQAYLAGYRQGYRHGKHDGIYQCDQQDAQAQAEFIRAAAKSASQAVDLHKARQGGVSR